MPISDFTVCSVCFILFLNEEKIKMQCMFDLLLNEEKQFVRTLCQLDRSLDVAFISTGI